MSIRDEAQALAATVGATASIDQFDGGLMVTVTLPGRGKVSASIEWGEEDHLLPLLQTKMQLAGWTEQRRRQYRLRYDTGQELTILAFDPEQAIKLAGRGQPDEITDLTTAADVMSWMGVR